MRQLMLPAYKKYLYWQLIVIDVLYIIKFLSDYFSQADIDNNFHI